MEPDLDHLFRRETGRMVAVLTRMLGVHNLALAEDVVQDAFCRALEVWKFRGLPENPSAWLLAAAKNRAVDVLRRERTARTFAPELTRLLTSEWTLIPTVRQQFEPHAIQDDQLRMMFTCCHPRLPEEAQVMLVLHLLCGFSVAEVAAAFISTATAVEKRIPRAKKVLAGSRHLFDIGAAEDFAARLPAVQRALYLLFNEGYHGASATDSVRRELCTEAVRLMALLLEHRWGAVPSSFALAALMRLHQARLPARLDAAGHLQPLLEQDRARWDAQLTDEGLRLLESSAQGDALSPYHLEAAIAAVHATAPSLAATDWPKIVSLYDALFALQPSPIVALSRAIALGQRDGPEQGLAALHGISGVERLASYPFYSAALGEFELRAGQPARARAHFAAALALGRNPAEREFFTRRLAACG